MDLDSAVSDEWVKYGTPPRKRKPSDEPGTPYSPAFPVKLPNTPQAKKIAAEETKKEEKVALEKKSGTGGTRRRRKQKQKKTKKAGRRTRRRRGGNTPLPPTNRCDYDSKCSHSDNGKHVWGRVGPGNYVCQNKCGCYFDDR